MLFIQQCESKEGEQHYLYNENTSGLLGEKLNCYCKIWPSKGLVDCTSHCGLSVNFTNSIPFPDCSETKKLTDAQGICLFAHCCCLIIVLAMIIIENLKNSEKELPYVALFFTQTFNFLYALLKYFYVSEDYELLEDSTISIVWSCSLAALSFYTLCLLFCIGYKSFKKFYANNSSIWVIEGISRFHFVVTSLGLMVGAIVKGMGTHHIHDYMNMVAFLPTIFSNMIYNRLIYWKYFFLLVYIEIIFCNFSHFYLPNFMSPFYSEKCWLADIVVFGILPIQLGLLSIQGNGRLRNLCGSESTEQPNGGNQYILNASPTKEEGVCCICLDENNRENYVKLPCSHYLHQNCLQELFQYSHTCPLCRTPLPALNIVQYKCLLLHKISSQIVCIQYKNGRVHSQFCYS